MKILLVLPPTAEKPAYAEPPAGLLYAGSALKRSGHDVTILDIYRTYITPLQLLQTIIDNNIEIVGFGGITTCYWYVKEATHLIRNRAPSVHLIAGGVLSSAHDLLLHHTPLDVICMKEGEITVVNIVNELARGKRSFEQVKGVAFLKDGQIMRTATQSLIANLDDIPVPNYDLIDMNVYAFDAMEDPFFSSEPSSREFYQKGMRAFNVKTARGCTNACTFCYRHLPGHRQHSVDYVLEHIRLLQQKYNIHFYRFGDELFTKNREWAMEFAERLLKKKISIKYIIHGVRTDTVDRELIQALHRSGCVMVFIGFESGSQKMLDVMKKNVTLEQNIDAVRTILESGLRVLVQTVIGMPGENEETIRETTDSLVRTGVDPDWVSINYAQAYPGTWLWQYSIKNGLITDQEQYLEAIGKSNKILINYTSIPRTRTKQWQWQILKALLTIKYKKSKKVSDLLASLNLHAYQFVKTYELQGMKGALEKTVDFLSSALNNNRL